MGKMTDEQDRSASGPADGSNVHQIFESSVNSVAGRDVVINQHIESERPLTNSERRQLGDLIRPLAIENQVDEWDEWRALHFPFGVNSIDSMDRSHFEPARQLLSAKLDAVRNAKKLDQAEREVGRLTALTRQYQLALNNMPAHQQHPDMQRMMQRIAQLEKDKTELTNQLAQRSQQSDELTVALRQASEQLNSQRKKNHFTWKTATSWIIAILVIISCLLVFKPAYEERLLSDSNLATMLKRPDICLFNGLPFSWGTRINTNTGFQKCVKSRTGQYIWQPGRDLN